MFKRCLVALVGVVMALHADFVLADVKLPAIIGSNMVLQSGKPVPIWGWADAGEKVTVSFGGQTPSAVADADGKWKVTLQPLQIGEPQKMTVAGKNTLTLDNVLVGSVWICGGQSNMQFPLNQANNAKDEIAKAKYPKLRMFYVMQAVANTPLEDCKGNWQECSPNNAGWFTAVGYFFAREIMAANNTPVGLIASNWGGTPAQAWVSLSGLEKDKVLEHYVTEAQQRAAPTPELVEKYHLAQADYQVKKKLWDERGSKAYQAEVDQWKTAAAQAKAAGQPEPPAPPQKWGPGVPTPPTGDQNSPTLLFNAMINPLIPYAIEGVIWYQGESNTGAPAEYRTLFPRLITDWREKWQQGDFPFLYVQLANFLNRKPQPSDSGWTRLREAQTMTLARPNTGMAVIIDIGEAGDIHPKDKVDVGHRLALAAQKVAFGKDIVGSGPLYKEMKIEGNQIRLSFTSIGGGLMIGAAPSIRPDTPPQPPLDHLVGFAICGADKKWVWADAKIDGETVVVSSDKVTNPVAVRYAWADNPECNLYNKEALPASPFRTDAW